MQLIHTESNHLLLSIVIMTALGCMIAAVGELRFSLFGFACQTLAVMVSTAPSSVGALSDVPQTEATRLVLLQVMLKELRMDPLRSISMFAPVCEYASGSAAQAYPSGLRSDHRHISSLVRGSSPLSGLLSPGLPSDHRKWAPRLQPQHHQFSAHWIRGQSGLDVIRSHQGHAAPLKVHQGSLADSAGCPTNRAILRNGGPYHSDAITRSVRVSDVCCT
jgi:hypothetical protein